MQEKPITDRIDHWLGEGPQSTLETKYVTEYLKQKGFALEDLKALPGDEAHQLMKEACQYASLKLAEVESRARFRDKIRGPSQ
jgi:hypothetical protein